MLSDLERKIACWVLAIAILAGYFVPGLSEMFAAYTRSSLFVLIVLSLLPMGRLDVEEVFSMDAKVWQVVGWQLLILPLIIVSGAHLARVDSNTVILLVTTAAAGSLFASPTFAELLQVNKRRALQCMVLSTFLMPLSYFLFFTLILHSRIDLDVADFVSRCMIYLVMPLGIFLIYMGFSRSLPPTVAMKVEGLSRRSTILALIVFGIGTVGPARQFLHTDPWHFGLYFMIVSAMGAGMAYLTAVVMFKQGISDALTASIVSGFRNVGLGMVLVAGPNQTSTMIYVGISQIPIFLAPLVLGQLASRQKAQDKLAQGLDGALPVGAAA